MRTEHQPRPHNFSVRGDHCSPGPRRYLSQGTIDQHRTRLNESVLGGIHLGMCNERAVDPEGKTVNYCILDRRSWLLQEVGRFLFD